MNPAHSHPAPASRNPWPYAIIGWFAVFGTAMAAWVVVAVRNDVQLVRPDYYDQEIRYQQQIDRQARTQPLHSEVKLAYHAAQQTVSLTLPAAHAARAQGKITFYRPSDAQLDRELKLSPSPAGKQTLDTTSLRPGLWKIRVQWTANGEEFYFDQTVTIAPNS